MYASITRVRALLRVQISLNRRRSVYQCISFYLLNFPRNFLLSGICTIHHHSISDTMNIIFFAGENFHFPDRVFSSPEHLGTIM